MANILVTGANGQLGSEIKKIGFSILDEVFYTDVTELDITDYEAIENYVKKNDIDTIVNCAAYTAVDRAEDDVVLARKINVDATSNLAKVAEVEGCLLIHVSTDYVFDGTATEPITEKLKPSHQSVYGQTKLDGENAIKKSGCLYIIIRTSWLYSTFCNNFVKTMLRLADERDELKVVDDQFGSPTYAEDLAAAIVKIMDNDDRIEHQGIYHFSNKGKCSWYEFASTIIEKAGKQCKINPISSNNYPQRAKRPMYSVFDCTKISNVFGIEIPSWQVSLDKMLTNL